MLELEKECKLEKECQTQERMLNWRKNVKLKNVKPEKEC